MLNYPPIQKLSGLFKVQRHKFHVHYSKPETIMTEKKKNDKENEGGKGKKNNINLHWCFLSPPRNHDLLHEFVSLADHK